MECITIQIERLEGESTRSSVSVSIFQAWIDWQARHKALETLQESAESAYAAVIDELLNDLHATTTGGNRSVINEDYYVSILVSLSF